MNNKDKKSQALFDGDDALFKSLLMDAKVYGEYGCGASTQWVLSNTNANVYSVDTSKVWVEKLLKKFDFETLKRAAIHHVDLGDVGDWGRPLTDDRKDDFHLYTNWLWRHVAKPDTILIDGRFRVCCFLTSLKFAAVGTRILFDDYTNRQRYHVVEEFVKKEAVCGRLALFIVPEKGTINYKALEENINIYRNNMD